MLTGAAFAHSVPQSWVISLVYIIFMMASFTSLVGCTGEAGGDSVTSSPSTSEGMTTAPSLDGATGNTATTTDFTFEGQHPPADSSEDFPVITVTSTPSGAAVRLNWLDSSDAESFGYRVYYGKQPAQEAGSCATYEANQAVDAPPATIAGLEPDTIYYFAVKHFNDSDDACSEEIIVAMPPAER